jgi:PTH1 family peptidyl-tRNA hydrolase
MILIVGLGNPGAQYEHTRHNVGADAVERLAEKMKLKLRHSLVKRAWIARGDSVMIARPDAYMNESGGVVAGLAAGLGVKAPLVVSDDLDLPPGTIRFRVKGSAGGHKGLASIISALGHSDFPRLRIGIGRPSSRDQVTEYVLSGFPAAERDLRDSSVDRAAEALYVAVQDGLARAMTVYSE